MECFYTLHADTSLARSDQGFGLNRLLKNICSLLSRPPLLEQINNQEGWAKSKYLPAGWNLDLPLSLYKTLYYKNLSGLRIFLLCVLKLSIL